MPARLYAIWCLHFSLILSFSFTYATRAPLAYPCLRTFAPVISVWNAVLSDSQAAPWSFSWFCLNLTFSLGPFLHTICSTVAQSPLPQHYLLCFVFSLTVTTIQHITLFTVFLFPLEYRLYEGRDFCMFCSLTIYNSAWSIAGTH